MGPYLCGQADSLAMCYHCVNAGCADVYMRLTDTQEVGLIGKDFGAPLSVFFELKDYAVEAYVDFVHGGRQCNRPLCE